MMIQPQFLTLTELLKGRLFRIPEYQRAYSWTPRQREDLFGDIAKQYARGDDSVHFMATMVGLRREKKTILTDDYRIIEVVDGQQRLTTLVILLKAIELRLGQDQSESKIAGDIRELLVKPDRASLLLLQTNHDSSHYFATYLREGTHPEPNAAKTIADRALLLAMKECEKFVDQWMEKETLSSLVTTLKNRFAFILHEIDDESVVYTVFEVLNSRGLAVSWVDRLKSVLMGIAFETSSGNRQEAINELHNLWRDIYACIGLRQGLKDEALRFAATLRLKEEPRRPLSEEDSVETLREAANDSVAGVIMMTKWIHRVTQAVDKLWADTRRHAVRKIAQARLLATAVYLRDDLTDKERDQILRRWENVTFRIYGLCENDARTRVGDYVRLAWRVQNERLSSNVILDALTNIGSGFPADKAAENLRGKDCYTDWGDEELRYFFSRYEEHLALEAGQKFDNEQWNRIWVASPSDSIEHIRPQSKGPESLVHRLGNLVLLPPGLNSTLGAKTPGEKASSYEQTGLLIAQDVAPTMKDWSKTSIDAREKKLIEWAKMAWAD